MDLKIKCVLSGIFFLLFCASVDAGTVAVSPPILEYKDVLKDAPSYNYIMLFNSGSEDMYFNLTVGGEMSDWFSFDPKPPIKVSAAGKERVSVIATPPKDTPNGVYRGMLHTEEVVNDTAAGGTSVTMASGIDVPLIVNITDKDTVLLNFAGAYARSAKTGDPVKFTILLSNRGNVKAKPEINIKIFREKEIDALSGGGDYILPGENRNITIDWDTKNREIGTYSADIVVNLGKDMLANKSVKFDILVPVSLNVMAVRIPQQVKLGGIIEVFVIVKNTGSEQVSVKLRETAYLNKEVVSFTESSPVIIESSGLRTINAFIPAESAGSYTVDLTLLYEGKEISIEPKEVSVISEENASKNAEENKLQFSQTDILILILIILVIVLILAIITMRKKSKQ